MQKISQKIQGEILLIILKNIPHFKGKIFLFGSYAQKKATSSSDIDICLQMSRPIELDILTNIKVELKESNIPYKVDIIDYERMEDSFKEIAFKEIIVWYPAVN